MINSRLYPRGHSYFFDKIPALLGGGRSEAVENVAYHKIQYLTILFYSGDLWEFHLDSMLVRFIKGLKMDADTEVISNLPCTVQG
ncbi:hypothetical protein LEP1GSC058_2903 [Leptospira fainei serovar Hurstbridge str. BUT 6]|uniref:Uncharacterized protein n=1 Tax=Leptospira fainei serovar Hurstbridge str. BUT 6 TaxID=1193011 RepID=S3W0I7_9LEPT|nr:hypothetical protein [Leptospira fainei]EPG73847.1 hypothetical protein LEP1GSC058_2903 [Leptospira fainei serovar Hurstbridge str. BUT 6]